MFTHCHNGCLIHVYHGYRRLQGQKQWVRECSGTWTSYIRVATESCHQKTPHTIRLIISLQVLKQTRREMDTVLRLCGLETTRRMRFNPV